MCVTRKSGREFAGILDTITAIGQTFPPAAVLAIAVPLVGYGPAPTLIAPHRVRHPAPSSTTPSPGLRSVPPAALDAASGMGFNSARTLVADRTAAGAPVILAGIRTSVMIAIGTATIGSTVGALTLGSPIIEGLTGSNTAYVLQGALLVGALAIHRRPRLRRPGRPQLAGALDWRETPRKPRFRPGLLMTTNLLVFLPLSGGVFPWKQRPTTSRSSAPGLSGSALVYPARAPDAEGCGESSSSGGPGETGRGLAYRDSNPDLRLNVPPND